jgi:hypothetical protein
MRVAIVSTDNLDRKRNKVIIRGLQENGCDLNYYTYNVWAGFKDKVFAKTLLAKLCIALRYLYAYLLIAVKLLFSRKHDIVYVPYLGLMDVILLWPIAKVRGEPIVWDTFVSLYDTLVRDRQMIQSASIASKLIYAVENIAVRLSDIVLIDTKSHAAYFREIHPAASDKLISVWVGNDIQKPAVPYKKKPEGAKVNVVFFGSFIPLHGLEVIYEAASSAAAEAFTWIIIGTGQIEADIEKAWPIEDQDNVERIKWLEYDALLDLIDTRADVCLGIFGDTTKAKSVIPNKVFDILGRGRCCITMDSPGMRELTNERELKGLKLISPSNAETLISAIHELSNSLSDFDGEILYSELRDVIAPKVLSHDLLANIKGRLHIKDKR